MRFGGFISFVSLFFSIIILFSFFFFFFQAEDGIRDLTVTGVQTCALPIYIFQANDRRVVFALPFEEDFTLVGTTDRSFTGDPASAAPSADEIAYLCAVEIGRASCRERV